MKVVICTIILVITSNLIRKITLNMLCSVPCCEVQQFFFFWLSMGRRSSIRTLNLKKSAMEVLFCTIIAVINSNLIRKITLNMLFSAPCCEVHQIFFFWLSIVMRSAITTLKLKEVSTVNGMFPELQKALSIFQKQVAIAGNSFLFTLFQDFFSLRALRKQLWFLSLDSERLYFRISNGYVIRIRCKH